MKSGEHEAECGHASRERNAPANIHATAIVLGTLGYLFVGPSGTGKTSTALACLSSAVRRGWNAALVSDDQVLISLQGDRLVARAPASIAGLAELRGVGPVPIRSVRAAVMSFAVLPVLPPVGLRVAPEAETWTVGAVTLPLLRLPLLPGLDPLDALSRFSTL
ncbi:Hpr(Ser) kinase/phosphatase [Rhizobium sp. PP-F2F-G48]|uniref:HPr kinase/phosphorylase n=1 Tax=Rhizobium sp. PP-F2F-G48 TaxID=2135651 RepID=UPI00104F2661|nr:HPr kinase/phosphorylase [Rhizobium sp. PP-F2F-G48]TCM54833.1 Hpr(Ser) kinase/phosphatase [Rhizobium sp. PP-F2F-G48]